MRLISGKRRRGICILTLEYFDKYRLTHMCFNISTCSPLMSWLFSHQFVGVRLFKKISMNRLRYDFFKKNNNLKFLI